MQLVTNDCTYLVPTSGNCVRKQEQGQRLILHLPLIRCGTWDKLFCLQWLKKSMVQMNSEITFKAKGDLKSFLFPWGSSSCSSHNLGFCRINSEVVTSPERLGFAFSFASGARSHHGHQHWHYALSSWPCPEFLVAWAACYFIFISVSPPSTWESVLDRKEQQLQVSMAVRSCFIFRS